MALVKDVVEHILFHVDAEASDSDPSQVSGVQQRAKAVRDTVATLKADNRNLALGDLLFEIRGLVRNGSRKASLQRTLGNIEQRPQLALQAWVGKNREL